jgi:hypothetical protein
MRNRGAYPDIYVTLSHEKGRLYHSKKKEEKRR